MKDYLDKKLKDYKNNYDPEIKLGRLANVNNEIKKIWKKECENRNINWRKINSNEDVYNLIDMFQNMVSLIEKIPYGSKNTQDEYDMLLAQFNALNGLRKYASFSEQKSSVKPLFEPLSKEEIDKLFDKMENITKRMNKQIQIKIMQD